MRMNRAERNIVVRLAAGAAYSGVTVAYDSIRILGQWHHDLDRTVETLHAKGLATSDDKYITLTEKGMKAGMRIVKKYNSPLTAHNAAGADAGFHAEQVAGVHPGHPL